MTTNPSATRTSAVDALKYAVALLCQTTDWTTDAIGGSCCEGDHELECDAINDVAKDIYKLAAQFGDPRRYSDGRRVKTAQQIEDGVVTEHVWNPDPSQEEPRSWRGNLRHDPDEKCPGIYEVTTIPETQEIHVRVVRTV